MAKRSRILSVRHEKNQGGCIRSLMSKLHLRSSRSTQRLLSDITRTEAIAGYGNSQNNSDLPTMCYRNLRDNQDCERTMLTAAGSKPSVKTLIEEEMFDEADAELKKGNYRKKSLKRGKNIPKESSDWDMEDSKCACNRGNQQSSGDDIKDILEYLSSLFQQRSSGCEGHDEPGEEKVLRALGKVLSRQLGSGRQLTEDEKLQCSKVFLSMLRLLNSTEFSLLELVQDPEVMLMKCVDILQESQSGKNISKGSTKSISSEEEEGEIFKRNVESSLVSSRIVILKPGMAELQMSRKMFNAGRSREIRSIGTKGLKTKFGAPCFLSDVKRKLVNIVTREYADVSAENIAKGSRKGRSGKGSGRENLENQSSNKDMYIQKVIKPSGIKIEDNFKHQLSVQTKRHLSEVITDEDEDTCYPSKNPETIGTILLSPELNCSCASPGKRWEYKATNAPTGSSSGNKSRIVRGRWRMPVKENNYSYFSPLTQSAETDMYAFKFLGENVPFSAASGDGSSTEVIPECRTSVDENGSTHTVSKEWHERELQPLSCAASPPMSLMIDKDQDLEIAIDLPERPSPISVLEAPFSDDDISPAIVKRVEFPKQALEIKLEGDDICVTEGNAHIRAFEDDKELVLDQVRALLQASNMKWEDLYLKSQDSDQILEPLLHGQHFFKDNETLLGDCVNEVLLETCACFFGRSCLSLVKQRIKPIPSMDFTVHEVCQGVKWHLAPIPLPRSLEQIVGKDFSRKGSWMDLTFEGENIGFEVCEAIFAELLEDTVLSSVG